MNLKNIIGIALLGIAFSQWAKAQQHTQQFSQEFEVPKNIETVYLYSHSPHVIIRRHKSNKLQIQTSVTTNIPNTKLLDLLAKKGRYTWEVSQPKDHIWELYANCALSQLLYRSLPAKEELVYLVSLPRRLREVHTSTCELWEETSLSYIRHY